MKEMYENEQKRCSELQDKLMEQIKKTADICERHLEKEWLRNDKQNECRESMKKIEEIKKEIAINIAESEVAHKKEMLERAHLMDKEILKQKVLTDQLNEEIIQLKNQLTAYEKQWEGYANCCKELSEKYEKRISITIDTFNEQIKDSKEVHRKEVDNLQLKIEFKEAEVIKLKNNQEAQRKELHDLQLKVEELNKGEAKKLEDTNEAYKRELHSLKVKLEELRKEVAKRVEDTAETHRKEMLENKHLRDEECIKQKFTMDKLKEEIIQLKNQLNSIVYEQATEQEDVQFTEKFEDGVKKLHNKELNTRDEIYEKRINKVIDAFNEQFKDNKETQSEVFHNLQLKIEELGEEAKILKSNEETCRNNLTLMAEKLIIEEVKNLEEQLKEQNIKTIMIKENIFASKLEDHEKICSKEINTKLEIFETRSKRESESFHNKIYELQLEVDKLISYFKQISEPKQVLAKGNINSKVETVNQNVEDSSLKETNECAKDVLIISASFIADILALMQKTGVCQHLALSYDLQTATINVDCDDPTEKKKIKEEFYTAYQELMMGGKIKEDVFPVDDVQQANAIVDECTKTFGHTYFRYDSTMKEIQYLSTDFQQMQHVQSWFKSMEKVPMVESVCIEPQLGHNKSSSSKARSVTIKLGDIVQEEVDIIVNAANIYLLHNMGVAAAINKASGGLVQTECRKIIHTKNKIPTGEAVATAAGGALKCKHVVHAVGPVADHHKNQCSLLLKKACISAMNVAQNFKAVSIAFPPISSGNCGVPADLVANVMLSTLCSYPCSNPTLLSDVRIVIIDQPTFDAFLNICHREQESLEQNATITVDVCESLTYHSVGEHFPSPVPDHIQPASYSHDVSQPPQTTLEIQYQRISTSNNTNTNERSTSKCEYSITSVNNQRGHYKNVPHYRYKDTHNGENKEEIVLNDFSIVNIPSGYGSNVDGVFTSPDRKPASDKSNPNPSLQPTLTNLLLNHAGEQNGPSPESSLSTKSMRQEKVSVISHLESLQPPAIGDRHTSSQKEQNSEIKDKTKEMKNDGNEKSKGKKIMLHCLASYCTFT